MCEAPSTWRARTWSIPPILRIAAYSGLIAAPGNPNAALTPSFSITSTAASIALIFAMVITPATLFHLSRMYFIYTSPRSKRAARIWRKRVRARCKRIDQRAYAVDGDPDRRPILDRSHTQGCPTGDHVAGQQRHIVGNPAHLRCGRKNHVGERVVLTLDAVEPGDHPRLGPVQIRHDDGTETRKGVVALGSAPLRKVDVLIQHFRRRDIVDAGVSENVSGGFALRHILAMPADDNPQLTLVGDLALIARGPPD